MGKNKHEKISRRDLIRRVGVVATGTAMFGCAPNLLTAAPAKQRTLRIAFLTDIHLKPEGRSVEGFTACLRHAQSLKDKPDLFFCGGDAILDCFAADKPRTQLLWDLWQKVLKVESNLPMECCIGNHDIWGGNRKQSGTTGKEPLYGRKWAMEVFGLASPYRSFDRGGWHFIFLDNTFILGDGQGNPTRLNYGYIGQLDEEQFVWLEADLRKTPREMPICLVSHIPMLSSTVFFGGATGNEQLVNDDHNWVISGSWVHIDAKRLKELFARHPNVKLWLSGHMHLSDRVDYNGVSYVCNGAVCGAWWNGPMRECQEGYGLIDLYSDGSFENQYVGYGWTAAH